MKKTIIIFVVCALILISPGVQAAVGEDTIYLPSIQGGSEGASAMQLQASGIQAGSASGGSGRSGSIEVVFAEPFSETPVAIGSLAASLGDVTFHTFATSPTELKIVWDSDMEEENVIFNWIAVSP